MPKCETCGKDFVVAEFEDFPEEVDVCYECQREWLRENVPEAFAEQVKEGKSVRSALVAFHQACDCLRLEVSPEIAADVRQKGVAAILEAQADERDCIELAGAIAESVESYDSDYLPEVIIPHLKPLVGELERLRQYREIMEEFQGKRIYAADQLLDHFDSEGNLKGDGKWRIAEIYKCVKEFDDASVEAGKKFAARREQSDQS